MNRYPTDINSYKYFEKQRYSGETVESAKERITKKRLTSKGRSGKMDR